MKRILLIAVLGLLLAPLAAAGDDYLSLKYEVDAGDPVMGVLLSDIDTDGKSEILAGVTSGAGLTGGAYGELHAYDDDLDLAWAYTNIFGPVHCIGAGDTGGLIIAVGSWNKVYAILGSGQLKWGYNTGVMTNTRALAFADINGDGENELLIAVGKDNSEITVLDKSGKKMKSFGVKGFPYSVKVDDIDADGRLDIIVATALRENQFAYPGYIQRFDLDGNRVWEARTERGIKTMEVFDIDGDGKKEIIAGARYDVYLFGSDGNPIWNYSTGWNVEAIKVLKTDGQSLIVAGSNDLYVLDKDGKLKWKGAAGPEVYSMEISDLDGDGNEDIVVGSDRVYIYQYGSEREIWKSQNYNSVKSVVVGDLNKDGYKEVIAGCSNNRIYVFETRTFVKRTDANGKDKKANNLYTSGKNDEALELAKEARALYLELSDNDGVARCDSLIESINVQASIRDKTRVEADEYYENAVSDYIAGNYLNASDFAEKAANRYTSLGDQDRANNATEISEKAKEGALLEAGREYERAESYGVENCTDITISLAKLLYLYDKLGDKESKNKTKGLLTSFGEDFRNNSSAYLERGDFENAILYANCALLVYNVENQTYAQEINETASLVAEIEKAKAVKIPMSEIILTVLKYAAAMAVAALLIYGAVRVKNHIRRPKLDIEKIGADAASGEDAGRDKTSGARRVPVSRELVHETLKDIEKQDFHAKSDRIIKGKKAEAGVTFREK